jgi:hypothetical protein
VLGSEELVAAAVPIGRCATERSDGEAHVIRDAESVGSAGGAWSFGAFLERLDVRSQP